MPAIVKSAMWATRKKPTARAKAQRQVPERLRHADRGDQHRGHRGEEDEADRPGLGVDHAGQPGVAGPGPPEHAEHQQALRQPRPGRVVGHQRRALGDREDEDEVEEELQRRDPLALAADRAQARGVGAAVPGGRAGLGFARGRGVGHAANPCKSLPRRSGRAGARAEDPEAQEPVAQQGRGGVGGDQDGDLDRVRGVRGERPEPGQRRRRQPEAEAEYGEPLGVVGDKPSRPRRPKVKRRLAAVLATALRASAPALAASGAASAPQP